MYGQQQRVNPEFKVVREEVYQASFKTGDDSKEVAKQILKDLDLEGAHSVRGNLDQGRLEINRNRRLVRTGSPGKRAHIPSRLSSRNLA